MPHPDVARTQSSQKEHKQRTVLGLLTPKKFKTDHGGQTRWGRLALNRAAKLLTTPRSAQKLKADIGLPDEQMPEILDGQKTPPSRRRLPFMTIQQDSSPIRVQIETDTPSPYKKLSHKRLDLVRKPSPKEIRRAEKMPLTRSKIKRATKRIRLEDIEKAQDTPRQFKNELRLSADIFAYAWGTNSKDTPDKDDFIPRNEKLHLVAHSVGGKDTLPNVVIADELANSQMMGPDAGAAALIEEGLCDYVDNTVEATLRQKPGSKLYTHHANSIEMTYQTDTGLIFKTPPINADLEARPSVDEIKLTKQLMMDCQKAVLAKQTEVPDNPEKSAATPLSFQKRKRKSTIESYFLDEHVENAITPHPAKRKKSNTPKSAIAKPNYKITAFFPIVAQENIPPQPQTSVTKCMFFTPDPQPIKSPLKELHPLPFGAVFG